MDFATSRRSTLGIEWELGIVDAQTRQLVPAATDLITILDDPRFDQEFLTNTIELISGVHETTDGAIAEMRQLRDALAQVARGRGLGLVGSGTHPLSRWREQEHQSAERYKRVVDTQGQWGRRLVIFGVHNHVGIEDRAKVIPIMHAILDQLPLILALSASSPLWQGEDTNFASHRSMLFQQISTGGVPPALADWSAYEHVISSMLTAGVLREINELRWDVRPAPALGTIEVRIADGAPSLEHLSAVTALTHCLVESASRAIDAGEEPAHLPLWFVRENKWRTVRYGLDADIIVNRAGAVRPVRDALAEMLEQLAPVAVDLGAEESLRAAVRVLASGGSAARQRERFRTDGCEAVVDDLVAEFFA